MVFRLFDLCVLCQVYVEYTNVDVHLINLAMCFYCVARCIEFQFMCHALGTMRFPHMETRTAASVLEKSYQ